MCAQKMVKNHDSIRKYNLISSHVPNCFLNLLCNTHLRNFETWNDCNKFHVLSSEKNTGW